MLSVEFQPLEIPLDPPMPRTERRADSRFSMRIALVIKTLDLDTPGKRSETVSGWTEDVSTSGTRIICPRIPLNGRVWINLRTRRLRKHWFEVDSIWSDDVRTTKGQRQRVGISFLEPLDHEELDRMLVARALAQLRARMPRSMSPSASIRGI
jgi:hypothetical protein